MVRAVRLRRCVLAVVRPGGSASWRQCVPAVTPVRSAGGAGGATAGSPGRRAGEPAAAAAAPRERGGLRPRLRLESPQAARSLLSHCVPFWCVTESRGLTRAGMGALPSLRFIKPAGFSAVNSRHKTFGTRGGRGVHREGPPSGTDARVGCAAKASGIAASPCGGVRSAEDEGGCARRAAGGSRQAGREPCLAGADTPSRPGSGAPGRAGFRAGSGPSRRRDRAGEGAGPVKGPGQ